MASGWKNILQWYDLNGRTGYLTENVSNGSVTLYLTNERGDIRINGHSVAQIANDINTLKNSLNWSVVLSEKNPGTYEIPSVAAKREVLITYGYVFQIHTTLVIPTNIFTLAGRINVAENIYIETIDDTHVKINKSIDDSLLRIFIR